MRNLLNPKWLLLLNTLPVVLLVLLCYGEFSVIQSLLPPASVQLWQGFGLGLAGLGIGTLAYAGVQLRRGREVGVGYSVLALVAYSAFLLLYMGYDAELVPRAVPRWMIPTEPFLYTITLLMPTLAHALFALVVHWTPTERLPTAAVNFVLAFVAPLAWYVLLLVPFSAFDSGHQGWFWGALFAVTLAAGVIGFLFFVVRGAYIMGLKRGEDAEFHLVWKLLIALILPVLGLLVNNGLFFGRLMGGETGVFGNFNDPWFYALAVLNGLLLSVPDGNNPRQRLLVFLGRSVLLGYTLYFFIVFLPFLPLSVLAVLLIGLGFLMLTPLVLLVVHVRELGADLEFLERFYPRRWLRAGLVAGFLTLPLVMTGRYLHNRWVLHEALAYRYSPDYSRRYSLDEQALVRTLQTVREHKERTDDFFQGKHVPYLATYFNWLVLDNLTLSDQKIADLEQLFLGTPLKAAFSEVTVTATGATTSTSTAVARPALTSLTSRSTYDAQQQAWVSWLDLKVANANTTQQAGEYTTLLELPTGCWVGNYYLDMNGRREPGILAEKKTAAWVYAQILNERQVRDPGLLAYTDDQHVSLRVYPVVGDAPRTTGIQLLHKEPVTLTIDGRQVTLGGPAGSSGATAAATANQEVVLVSAAAKAQLPLVRRTPYYHFLLDVSAAQVDNRTTYAAGIKSKFALPAADKQTRFTLVDAYTTPVPTGASWQQALAQHESRGGFYLEGALRKLLFEVRQHPGPTYPVIVVVTDKPENAIWGAGLAELSSAYPEGDQFYVLASDGRLAAHSLRTNSQAVWPDAPAPGTPQPVRAWPDAAQPRAYLPNNERADIVVNDAKIGLPQPTSANSRWQTGLLLHGYQQWQAFHPEATDQQRVPFVQASFRAGIMTPFTAYLALENEAQKAALARKQQQVLNANAALDVDESSQDTVTEVPIDGGVSLLLAAGVGLGVRGLRRRKQARGK
ncbi:MSEP-CTERM sorting domain-containing protein [Hymenobacter metallicola]|uniref:MSEP-CTERM sorting domain-containing protein n=1 Tax=Hymenobacter metallicola TaxID=2563114 RepID=A0A4Z0QI77_9BACT|nr:MSEP-CTERM sorting domain-containing protein [Hymenobacter metallicola]TGE29474.1 MSEP-CTERM sorting domain-containing protein [Hymenobacter metallicola]